MEEFENVYFWIKLNKWCNRWIAKRGWANSIGPVDQRNKMGWGKLLGGDEKRKDVEGELLVTKIRPFRPPVFRESWDIFWDIKPAIWSKASQDNLQRETARSM